MIFPDLGEIGIHMEGGVNLVLRPSFYAMSKLGSPAEIVEIFADVMSEYSTAKLQEDQHRTALAVLYACAPDNDTLVVTAFGHYAEAGKDGMQYVQGLANPALVLVFARTLMRHGVIGNAPALPRHVDAEPTYMREFHAREHAAIAMAHLGMSERDAWACTMTSLALAMRQKYPPSSKDSPGVDAPSAEEFDAAMEWADKLDALRN